MTTLEGRSFIRYYTDLDKKAKIKNTLILNLIIPLTYSNDDLLKSLTLNLKFIKLRPPKEKKLQFYIFFSIQFALVSIVFRD